MLIMPIPSIIESIYRKYHSVYFQAKCDKYWPDKGTEKYGDIEVTLVNTEEFAHHVTHTLRIIKVYQHKISLLCVHA